MMEIEHIKRESLPMHLTNQNIRVAKCPQKYAISMQTHFLLNSLKWVWAKLGSVVQHVWKLFSVPLGTTMWLEYENAKMKKGKCQYTKSLEDLDYVPLGRVMQRWGYHETVAACSGRKGWNVKAMIKIIRLVAQDWCGGENLSGWKVETQRPRLK